MLKKIISSIFILFFTCQIFAQENFEFDSLIYSYYDTKVIKKGDLSYILNTKFQVLDSFIDIQPYEEISLGEDFYVDENGDYVYPSKKMEQKFPELVLVFKLNSNKELEKAIYDFWDHKIISPWIKGLESDLLIEKSHVAFYSKRLYTYSLGEYLGFYVQGMKVGTPLTFFSGAPIESLWNFISVPRRSEDLKITHHLFNVEKNELNFISDEYEVSTSESYKSSYPKIDIETGEPYIDPATGEIEYECIPNFKENFLILKNKENKFGAISINNFILKPQFDSIYENLAVPNFINLVKKDSNGKIVYGNFNLFGGEFIEARYEEVISFSKSSFLLRDYYYFSEFNEEENQNVLFNMKGQKFYNTPEEVFIKQENKKFGLYTYPYLYPDKEFNKLICQVPALYKNLEQTPYKGVFKAQSKNKKWGLISFLGDTLIPLNYDRFEIFVVDAENYFSFFTFQDKKIGVYDLYKGEIQACKFDEICNYNRNYVPESTDRANYNSYYLTKINKKYGLLDSQGNELLPTKFDTLYSHHTWDGEKDAVIEIFLTNLGEKKQAIFFDENFKTLNSLDKLLNYDFIHKFFGYIKQDNSFNIYFLAEPERYCREFSKEFELEGLNCTVVFKNGKFSLKKENEELLVPFDYDLAYFMDYTENRIVAFKNGIKYYIETENFKRFTEEEWKNKQ